MYDFPDQDFAVISVSGFQGQSFIPWGNSKKLVAGDTVIEIGSPFGLGVSASRGIVSAIKPEHIQYDAATNPGTSGGVVMNDDGQAIGMADQIFSTSSPFTPPQNAGIAFAVPAQTIIRQLRTLDLSQ